MGGDKEPGTTASKTSTNPAVVALEQIGRPYEGYCLVFDCETTTDLAQGLRIGAYEIHGIPKNERLDRAARHKLTRVHLDICAEQGLFYDEAALTRSEIETIQQYARVNHLKVWSHDAFVREVIYAWAARLTKDKDQLLIVGHNLAFDISRIAMSWTNAADAFRGGFSFKLCDCPNVKHCGFHPSMRVKKLGPGKHRFKMAAASNPVTGQKYGHNVRFLDTMTFGRAMLNTGRSLREMGEKFRASVIKENWENTHGGEITQAYLSYCLRDVAATWSLYCAERDYYRSFNLRRKPWNIFSSASLGKAHLQEFGMKPFLPRHKNVTPAIIGPFMASYYGGRSEVRIRLARCQVMLTDFKSQYPTVNALMQLQKLLLAKRIIITRDVEGARRFLDNIELSDLQRKETWPALRGIVKILPRGDRLPVRTEYDPRSDDSNIGVSIVTEGPAVWYTIADALVSKLLTGRTPEIVDAILLHPDGEIETTEFDLFGRPEYRVDLKTDDLFTRIIDIRTEIKANVAKATDGQAKARSKAMEQAVKELANATSYGVLMEINTEDFESLQDHQLIAGEISLKRRIKRRETPGTYFAGPLGTLITGAGRLLLAMAERLGRERGLGYLFCDTDSLCFARPDGMHQDEFRGAVRQVCEWFRPLSPYKDGGGILRLEDCNFVGGQLHPLFGVAVSAKRYVLFHDAEPESGFRYHLRKASRHGLGHVVQPVGYQSRLPAPQYNDELGVPRFVHDLWHDAIIDIEKGEPHTPQHASLNVPLLMQATVATPAILKLYEKIQNIRPFSFFTVLPHVLKSELDDLPVQEREKWLPLTETSFYAPKADRFEEIAHMLRRRDNDELVDLDGRAATIIASIERYFDREEAKSFPSYGHGELQPWQLKIVGHRYIGKETNSRLVDLMEATEGIIGAWKEQIFDENHFGDGHDELREKVKAIGPAIVVKLAGGRRQTIYDFLSGKRVTKATIARYQREVEKLESSRQ